jgi:hypothetical protein
MVEPIVQKRERPIVDGAAGHCRMCRTRQTIRTSADRAKRGRDPAV